MTNAPPVLLLYCFLIVVASLAGGWIPLLVRLTHTRMQLALSFVAGAMLGVGLLHLVPHAFVELRSIDRTVWWMLGGFLTMFFLERLFHAHQHGPIEQDELAGDSAALEAAGAAHAKCGHEHGPSPQAVKLHWAAALLGLSVHSLLDGVALAASTVAETHGSATRAWAGLAVFLAVVLHKPFDSLTLGTLMAVGGKPSRQRHLVNLVYALAVPAGAVLFFLGFGAIGHALIGAVLAFAAGMFLCIATSDLLPELHFHSHDRFKLSAALVLGLALAAGIMFLEDHGHDHDLRPHDHEHHDHEH